MSATVSTIAPRYRLARIAEALEALEGVETARDRRRALLEEARLLCTAMRQPGETPSCPIIASDIRWVARF